MTQPLPVPDLAQADSNAIELVRIWAASGQQHVSIATDVWENPAAWGIMLVDLAKHIAESYEGENSDRVLQQIKQGFDTEWSAPTE